MRWTLLFATLALAVSADAPVPDRAPLPSCTAGEGSYRRCVQLLPMERIKGIWFVGNEESTFRAEETPLLPVRVVTEERLQDGAWLDVGWPEELDLLARVPPPSGEGDTARYRVDFIGRRARETGEYGHMGMSRHLIVLDRMLAIAPAGRVRTRIEFDDLSCWIEECGEVQAQGRDGR